MTPHAKNHSDEGAAREERQTGRLRHDHKRRLKIRAAVVVVDLARCSDCVRKDEGRELERVVSWSEIRERDRDAAIGCVRTLNIGAPLLIAGIREIELQRLTYAREGTARTGAGKVESVLEKRSEDICATVLKSFLLTSELDLTSRRIECAKKRILIIRIPGNRAKVVELGIDDREGVENSRAGNCRGGDEKKAETKGEKFAHQQKRLPRSRDRRGSSGQANVSTR